MRLKREVDGTTVLFGWTAHFFWFWHAMADGTRMCRCRHSVKCREIREEFRVSR